MSICILQQDTTKTITQKMGRIEIRKHEVQNILLEDTRIEDKRLDDDIRRYDMILGGMRL